jgi:hypothetical protein
MMLFIITVTRCGSSYKYCSASLHAAKVAGQHERNSAPVAATHCAGNAELSDTTDLARAADNGTHSHPEEKQRPRRRRRPRPLAPEGFHTVAALAASGDPGRSTLYRCIQTGQLPAHKWRGRLVVADRDYKELFVAVKPLQRAGADNADVKVRHD